MTRREVIELILKLKGGDETAREVKSVSSSFGSLKTVVAGIGAALAGVSVAELLSRLSSAVDKAGDLNESLSKVQTLFGADAASEMYQWAKTADQAMGLTSQAALDAVGNIGNMFLQLKATPQQSEKLSTSLVKLSSDLASFHNAAGGASSVLESMQSAFRGEYDALKRYIPTISAATVQEQALADTHKNRANELSALDKALATYKIILRDAGAAAGDFERTSGEFANTTRRLDSAWENFAATLGNRFLPAATRIKNVTASILQNLTQAMDSDTLDQQIAEAQAKYDTLLLERDQREEWLDQRRREREKRLQEQRERYMRRNAGPMNTESARILREFQTQQKAELEAVEEDPLKYEIEKARQLLDRLKSQREAIDAKQKAAAAETDTTDAPGEEKKTITAADRIEARVDRLKALTDTQLAELDSLWDRGMVAIKNYFDQRQQLIEKQYQTELKGLQDLAAAETDPVKQLQLETEIFEREEQHKRDLIEMAAQQADAERRLADERERLAREAEREAARRQREADKQAADRRNVDDLMDDISLRTQRADAGGDLDAKFGLEMAELDARHEEEIRRLRELNATKEQIDEAYRLQKIEKDRLALAHEQELNDARIQMAADVAGGMSTIFDELYELSGKKQKEFFYLAKAAAIAEATMNVAKAFTGALGSPPYGAAAIIQAGIVAAAGAVQIAKISAQTLATGGPVLGYSPGDRADNIPIMATADEYMVQRPSARYYGRRVMDAINNAMIPRGLIEGFLHGAAVPVARPSYALATGGPVPATPAGGGQAVNITNLVDPREIDAYLASAAGQRAVLNVVSSNAQRVRRVMLGRSG